MPNKKVLIMHISEFGGHRKAAENIKSALESNEAQIEAITINGLGYFYPRGEKFVETLYKIVIKHFPDLWGNIYDRERVAKKLSFIHTVINKFAFRKLSRLIKDIAPDCIVATQAFPCGVVADYKSHFGINIPLIAVVTDYHPHRFWIHAGVDHYVVACNEASLSLIKHGVIESKIKVFGIPISAEFITSHTKEEISKQLGFVKDMDTVLIMGGGLGLGPMEKIARQLDAIEAKFQIIVICGKNKLLYRWFKNNARKFKKPLFYYGYVRFIKKLMEFCDIVITKGGGITISEALTKGIAIIVTNSIPGQEEKNVEYLLSKQAMVAVEDFNDVAGVVRDLITDKKRLAQLKKNSLDISRADASLRIRDLILASLQTEEMAKEIESRV